MYKRFSKLIQLGNFTSIKIQCDDFKPVNLIYGENYSGKTSLSRVFLSLQTGKIHDSLSKTEFILNDYTGQNILSNHLESNKNIRVFNEEYVQNNIHWEESIEPFLVIGIENKEKFEYLKLQRDRARMFEYKKEELKQQSQQKEKQLDNKLSASAKRIRELFSIPGYNRSHFLKAVEKQAYQSDNIQLSNSDQKLLYKTAISTEKKENINHVKTLNTSIPELFEELNNLLDNDFPSATLDELRFDPNLSNWIEQGLELHNDKLNKCKFCGNELPNYLLDQYNEHFSEHYRNLQHQLELFIIRLQQSKFESDFPNPAEFYLELKDKYLQTIKNIEILTNDFNKRLDEFVEIAKRKQQHLFDAIEFDSKVDDSSLVFLINAEIEQINSIITRNNDITAKFEFEKEQAKDKLISSIVSEFLIQEMYLKVLEEWRAINREILEIDLKINRTSEEIRETEMNITNSGEAVEVINNYLGKYYAKTDIHLEVAEGGRFLLKRDGLKAKFLSQSERTIIALSYFLVSLKNPLTALEDNILFVDDPVIGLDQQHLKGTINMLLDCFGIASFNEVHSLKINQCFIATHNDYFFNTMRAECQQMCPDLLNTIKMSSNNQEHSLFITSLK